MRRRRFLLAAAALVAAAVVAGLSRLLGKQAAQPAPEPEERADSSIFPATSQPLLIAIADAIVPRDGEHPAASEIDIVPQLERWVSSTPQRLHLYKREWRLFAAGVRLRLPFAGGRTSSEVLVPLLEQWFEAFRTQPAPDGHARFFEQLRQDVLRVYYGSPAGWASLGYTGPAYLAGGAQVGRSSSDVPEWRPSFTAGDTRCPH